MTNGFTLWLTGLSGAGKSTLAGAIGAELARRGLRVEILDGDEVRTNLSQGLGFSKVDRDANVRRIGFVARLLSRHGVVAITAAISPYRDARREVRAQHEAPFIEVFVECPLAVLIERDRKGLYARALRGELDHFTGINDPYEPPAAAEVVVRTDRQTIEESVGAIIRELERRGLVERTAAADSSLVEI